MPTIVASEKTDKLIQEWKAAKYLVEQGEARLKEERERLTKAEVALGNWMLPLDAVRNEVYRMWIGNDILSVYARYNDRSEFQIQLREKVPVARDATE